MTKRVLITGDKGFIGQWVVRKLAAEGFQTEGFDVVDGCDIHDARSLVQKMDGCNAVVHLAAIEEEQSPTRTMETNLQGTWNVLCSAKETSVEKIVFLSSVDALGVFQGEGIPKYLPLDDDYPCHPRTSYAISKKLAEEMCRYFSATSGIPVVCLRPPGVWDDATYERISAARKDRPEFEWDPYWEYGAFIDVRDLAEAVSASLQNIRDGFHCLLVASDDITTSDATSLELVRKIHPDVPWKGGEAYATDPYKSLVNTDNAKSRLNWSPRHSWRKYLAESRNY